MKDYEQISSKMVYNGKIMRVYSEEVVLPNGKAAVREVVRKSSAAAVCPIDADGKIILVEQYRHPIGGMALEIPAGLIDEGEDVAVCAARELAEEVGYHPTKLTKVCTFVGCIGFCDEAVTIYIGEGLEAAAAEQDDEEFITIHRFTLDECLKMVTNGKIIDSKTIAALFYLKAKA